MVLENLYPTDLTDGSGREYTKKIPEIPVTEPEFTDAYWLGWLAWENLPSTFIQSQFERDAETNQITITPVTVPENIDIGYSMPVNSSSAPAQINPSFLKYDETQSKWVPWTNHPGNASELRLPNKYDINTSLAQNIFLQFAAQISTTEDGNSLAEYIFSIGLELDSFRDFNNATFIVNSNTINQEVGSLPNDLEFGITINELDGELHSITAGNYFVKIAMCSYGWVLFNRDIKPDGSGSVYSYPAPTIRTHTSAIVGDEQKDQTWVIAASRSTYLQAYNWLDGGGYRVALATGEPSFSGYSAPWDTSSYFMMGGYEGSYNGEDVRTALSGNMNLYKPEGANFFFQGVGRNDLAVIRRIYSYEDAYKHLALMPRMLDRTYEDVPTNNTYDNGTAANRYNKWYALVTPNNEFTGKFVSGQETDKLREWQLIGESISPETADYETDDKPEYIPEEGDTTDDDEGTISLNTPGALGATNAFVTRYVLNTQQINRIGRNLWSTLGDGNELTWKNFFLTISGSDQIDYSLTLSEIISYFISLKYFPFDLSSISSSTGEVGIRVGTGATLIEAGSTTKTINDGIIRLDGGRCTIPNKWRNYLDLEPYATASIYIPYCGTTEIPMSVISGEQLGITYLVDMTTGAMTAVVMKYSGSGTHFPIAVMNGSCGFDILVTGTNGNSQMTNAITNLASKATQWTGQVLQSGITGIMGGAGSGTGSGSSAGAGAAAGMISTALNIGQDMLQNNIQMPKLYATAPMTSGSSSSLSSLILPQTAYVQIRRHNPYASGSNYKSDMGILGYRSAYTGTIASANGMGFVKCQNPNLTLVSQAGATEKEINAIKSLLSDGIFT